MEIPEDISAALKKLLKTNRKSNRRSVAETADFRAQRTRMAQEKYGSLRMGLRNRQPTEAVDSNETKKKPETTTPKISNRNVNGDAVSTPSSSSKGHKKSKSSASAPTISSSKRHKGSKSSRAVPTLQKEKLLNESTSPEMEAGKEQMEIDPANDFQANTEQVDDKSLNRMTLRPRKPKEVNVLNLKKEIPETPRKAPKNLPVREPKEKKSSYTSKRSGSKASVKWEQASRGSRGSSSASSQIQPRYSYDKSSEKMMPVLSPAVPAHWLHEQPLSEFEQQGLLKLKNEVEQQMDILDASVPADDVQGTARLDAIDENPDAVVEHDMEPVVETSDSVYKKPEAVDEKLEPVDRKWELVIEKQEPVDEKLEPVDRKWELVIEKYELVDEKPEPVNEKLEPVDAECELVIEKQEPVDEKPEPVDKAALQLVLVDQKPGAILVKADSSPGFRLVLKVAKTKEELLCLVKQNPSIRVLDPDNYYYVEEADSDKNQPRTSATISESTNVESYSVKPEPQFSDWFLDDLDLPELEFASIPEELIIPFPAKEAEHRFLQHRNPISEWNIEIGLDGASDCIVDLDAFFRKD